jgi:mRNA interferase RelE/StbE
MEFTIIWSDSATETIEKLDRSVAKQIYKKVDQLKINPHRYLKKLINSPFFRLRVGDYRVIVEIKENILQILVVKVGHRSLIYD